MTAINQSKHTLSALLALQLQVNALIKDHGTVSTPSYGKPPHALLDAINSEFGLKNDADLARNLKKSRSEISKVRHGCAPGDALILAIHETFDFPVARIRQLLAAA